MQIPENKIASAEISQLFPGVANNVPLAIPSAFMSNFSAEELPALFPYEQLVLAAITHSVNPKCVVEFCTGQGFATYVFSSNSATQAKVFTVDLAPEDRGGYSKKILRGDTETGRVYKDAIGAEKVRQLFVTADGGLPEELSGKMGSADMIFVDGDHGYEGVRRDTEYAVRLAGPNATLLWHDFYIFPNYLREGPEKRGVFPWLNEFAVIGGFQLYHIIGTYIVIGRKNWPSSPSEQVRNAKDLTPPFGERIPRLAES